MKLLDRLNGRLRALPHNGFNQRWGIGTTMTLKNSDGDVYLFRRRVFQTPWLALYVHDIHEPDEIVSVGHSHPFGFLSLIVRGGYVEHVWHTDGDTRVLREENREHGRGGINLFPRGARMAHSITSVRPYTKTLVLAGPRKDSWGWFVPGRGVVHWSTYLVEVGRTERDARVTS